MNILMLNYEFPPIGGGGGQAHQNLLRQYAGREDLKVDVLTCGPQPGLVTETPAGNITIYKVGIRKKDLHFWRRTEVLAWLVRASRLNRRLVRGNPYDLAHAFFGFPTGWLCYRQAGRLPYVISLRGSDVPGRHTRLQMDYKILAPLMRAIWSKASGLVACSEGLKDRALEFAPSAFIEVIPNGVDLERFHPPGEERYGREGPLRLLTVGRLSATKRVDMLVDAVESLRAGGTVVRLTVAGGGALEPDLRRLVADRELGEWINVTGRVDADRMPELYRQHDVFVSATMQEGMSNAMLEAMASGLPIVTTRCEGVDELIADNGIVVGLDSSQALARTIQELARNTQRLVHMSQAARQRATRCTWQAVADQYVAYYRQILNEQPIAQNA
jgi:L-malate glycosyltransferase